MPFAIFFKSENYCSQYFELYVGKVSQYFELKVNVGKALSVKLQAKNYEI